MKHFIIIAFAILSFSAKAQNKQADTIWVDGICEMCKQRIENALDTKGVWVAEWDVNTKLLYVVYKPSKVSKTDICNILNNVGHDTEFSKASEEQYNTVHKCCLYRDETVKKQHENQEGNE